MPTCNLCDDVGFYRYDVPFGDPRFGRLIRCSCKATEDAHRLQRLSGLTDFERSQTLDQISTLNRPGTLAMVQHCKRFIHSPTYIMTIWGGAGNAKTMALQSVVNHFVDQKIEAVYVTAFDLISYIRSAFVKENGNDLTVNDGNAYQRLLQFERVQILAVDEFDKIRVTDWVREQLTDLIDRRYRLAMDEQAGTLIAMNDDPRNLPDWIYSRLAQNVIVHNFDSDMRPAIGEQMFFTDPRTGELVG
jgi:DNA replication protein DnaC